MSWSDQEAWRVQWEVLQGAQRAAQLQAAQAQAAPTVAALRAAFAAAPRRPRDIRADLAALNGAALVLEATRATRAASRGRRPDGRPVSLADKRAAWARYEQVLAEGPAAPRPKRPALVAGLANPGVPPGQVCRYW